MFSFPVGEWISLPIFVSSTINLLCEGGIHADTTNCTTPNMRPGDVRCHWRIIHAGSLLHTGWYQIPDRRGWPVWYGMLCLQKGDSADVFLCPL